MRRGAEQGLLLFLAAALPIGCTTDPKRGFDPRSVAKSDIDLVVETHQGLILKEIGVLLGKLYRRNPDALRQSPFNSIAEAQQRLKVRAVPFRLADGSRGTDAVRAALAPDYTGDRVFSFCGGLASMIVDAYGGKQEFFLTDKLDAQKLYNAARNIEIAAWILRHRKGADGRPLLISASSNGVNNDNLSFARLFGKITAWQDATALIIADKNNRHIKNVIQRLATAVFLPI